ncbi:ZMYM5 protein, partial [Polypterus senegalus]
MKNGEKILRSWIFYSMSTDSVFCFACTVFGKRDNALSNCGFRTWRNLAHHLKEHKYSKGHCDNMTNWHELQRRLQTNTTIDQRQQDLMRIEIEHWKGRYSDPIVTISSSASNDSEVNFTCKSAGGYPEPKVYWSVNKMPFQDISRVNTRTSNDSKGRYSVTSILTLNVTGDVSVTCIIENERLRENRTSNEVQCQSRPLELELRLPSVAPSLDRNMGIWFCFRG